MTSTSVHSVCNSSLDTSRSRVNIDSCTHDVDHSRSLDDIDIDDGKQLAIEERWIAILPE
jgi:hypothetical protein